ncbi:sugar transferase [Seonamhaeicola algicola]|uniref:Sugar transferase n=1 Tax=Seonamhaeicola algicola TaxID=1719036 RepID=A0A5C7AVH8_9FLAO|nr:sugar transferase [Seonamhaeicola algicola]TXE11673.1 sugar transferase [Seonamhaeicola algicola]
MYSYIKPIIDFLIAFTALVLLSPIFITVAIILAISNNGSIFFFQERPGKHERIFKIIKFKTMRDLKANEDSNGLNRVTKTGNFLRTYSLDEIPQLINVLKGDMSIVGPRPLMVSYITRYNDFQKQRHHVKPGITGWAQVKGRNAISWEKKFEYDVYYVHNQSFALDVKIMLLTFLRLIKPQGVNSNANVNMPEFTGTK